MSPKKLSTRCAEERASRSSDSSPTDLGATDSQQFAGVSAMSVLKRSACGLKALFNSALCLSLLWLACTVAQAGGVVVDATRSFTVGKNLSDLQDPPLTVSAVITNSPIKILTEVKVGLHLVGEPSGRGFASEIYVSLNKDLQVSSILLNQVGVRDSDLVGFGYDGWQVTFSDSAVLDVHLQDIGSGVMTGEIQPDGRLKPEDILRPAMLSAMLGGTGNGDWYLSVADLDFGGTMRLESWSLTLAGLTNRPPAFVGLTNDTIPEMVLYQQTLRAVDPDFASQAVSYSLESGPTGSEVVNGVFRWNPSEGQGPSTNVIRVVATDGSDASTNTFTVIVNEVNRAPSLVGASEVTFPEGALYTLPLVGADPDVPEQSLGLRVIEGPDGSELVDGVFRWTPLEEQGPSTNRVWVEVTDGIETVTNAFLVIVTEANQAPVMTPPVSDDVDELSTYEQRFSATDDDVPAQEVSFRLVSGPAGSVISDGIFSWTPSEAMGPSVQTILVAADDGLGSVTNAFTLRVSEVNRPPVFSGLIGATIPKLTRYTQSLVGIDLDLPAQPLSFWMVSGPVGASVVGNVFTWTPSATQGDLTHQVVVAVSDGLLSVTNSFSLMVGGENSAPRFTGLSAEEAPELAEFSKLLSVADSDVPAQLLTVSLIEGPVGAEVSGGRFVWFPTEAQGPSTNRIVVAVSDGFAQVTNEFVLTITEVNRLSVWGALTNATIDVDEPYAQRLVVSDSDLPPQPLVYRLVSGPSGARISQGMVQWTPGLQDQLSSQTLMVAVDDGYGSVTNSLVITVRELTASPVFVGLSDTVITENFFYSQTLRGLNHLGTPTGLSFRLVSGPAGAVVQGDRFEWIPTEVQGPSLQTVRVAVTEGRVSLTNEFRVTVIEVNSSPSWPELDNPTIPEMQPYTLRLRATDADIPLQSLQYLLLTGPVGATLSDDGVFTWTPDERHGPSTNVVRVAVSDGQSEASTLFTLVVQESNQRPAFVGLSDARITERTPYSQVLLATDADVPVQTLSYRWVDGPVGSGVTNGVFSWVPGSVTGDTAYSVAVAVSDGSVSVTNRFNLVVSRSNGAPYFMGLANGAVTEGSPYQQLLRAGHPQLSESSLSFRLVSGPIGALLEGAVFRWTPSESQGPSTNLVRVSVSDGVTAVTNGFTVLVEEANQAPIFAGLTNAVVAELVTYTQGIRVSDADLPAQTLNLRLVVGPAGAQIVGTNFIWTPTEAQGPSAQIVRIAVSDGVQSVTNAFTVMVQEAPTPPSLAALLPREIPESAPFLWAIPGVDSDVPAQTLSYRLLEGPSGSVLTNGVFAWTPDETLGGSSAVLKIALSDGELSVTNSVVLSVLEVNQPPVPTPLGTRRVSEGNVLSFTVGATDADLPAQRLSYSAVSATAGMTVSSNGVVSWRPTEAQGPSTNMVLIRVSDDGKPALSATNAIEIVVREVNTSPSLAALQPRELPELAPFVWAIPGVDSDVPAQTLNYRLLEGPSGSVLTNGVFAWTPDETLGGSSAVLKIALSDGELSVTNSVVLSVLEVNQPPVPTPLGTRRVSEGNVLSFTVGATDADLPAQRLSYSAVSAPAGMTVSSNGVVSWRPTEAQGPSTNMVLIRVSDDGKPALSATNAIEIVVREVNTVPVLDVISDRTVKLPGLVSLTLRASDADLPIQPLTYRLVSGPAGMTVGTDGSLRWSPTESQARSTNLVSVLVSDGVTSASTGFVVVVEASPRLSLQVTGGTAVVIQVAGPAGALCRLEQAETATGAWTPVVGVADVVTQGFNTPVPVAIPGPLQTGRLYRLRVL